MRLPVSYICICICMRPILSYWPHFSISPFFGNPSWVMKPQFPYHIFSIFRTKLSLGILSVDCIKWVRPDCILLGCFRLIEDGTEEGYFVQIITSRDGKITEVSDAPNILLLCNSFCNWICIEEFDPMKWLERCLIIICLHYIWSSLLI